MAKTDEKGYNINQLVAAVEDRELYNDTHERLLREIKVEEAKLTSLKEELVKAEADLHKCNRRIREIAKDLE